MAYSFGESIKRKERGLTGFVVGPLLHGLSIACHVVLVGLTMMKDQASYDEGA